MNLTTTHVLPEFLNSEAPIDGARYVLAELGPDHRLDIYTEHPTYDAQSDSWTFNDTTRRRHEEDCWLPEPRYIQIVAARGLRQDFGF